MPKAKEPRKSLSYEELMAADPDEIEGENLDDETLARAAYIGRFFQRLGELGPANMKVGDVMTEDDLQAVWRETADENAPDEIIGRHPLVH